jgi:adenosine deaminase
VKCFDPKYNALPKTEIHCHLEGAIRTQTIIDIAREHGVELPSYDAGELNHHVKVYDQLHSLGAVLEAFAIAQNSIASISAVRRIAREMFEDAHAQNIKLLEVRFSPDWAFSGHRLHWDAALEAILAAQAEAEEKFGMVIGLIAISSRSMGLPSCEKTVDWAIRNREHIHAIDLADCEADCPIKDFAAPVLRAQDAGLKVTVHSGEDTAAAAVAETIQTVKPDRIGHGTHIIDDPKVIDLVRNSGVTLEMNPWSNYLTNSVKRIEDHPLKKLFDLGVKVTINSDDPEVLETNLNNEYRIAHEILGMSVDEIVQCNRYAVDASFVPEKQKSKLRAQFWPCEQPVNNL